MVIGINLLLRPLVQRINRQPLSSVELQSGYVVNIVCKGEGEAHVRALLLQGLSAGGIQMRRLDSSNIEDPDRVEVLAEPSAARRSDSVVEQMVGRPSLESAVTAARWRGAAVARWRGGAVARWRGGAVARRAVCRISMAVSGKMCTARSWTSIDNDPLVGRARRALGGTAGPLDPLAGP
jgi:hypothetical protein